MIRKISHYPSLFLYHWHINVHRYLYCNFNHSIFTIPVDKSLSPFMLFSYTENPEQDMVNQQQDTLNAQEEIGKSITSTRKRVRGLTRLVKLHRDFEDSNEKHEVDFDALGRVTGKYRSEFASFLGDLVRRDVGLRYMKWKKVTKEVKDKLWEQVTVCIY